MPENEPAGGADAEETEILFVTLTDEDGNEEEFQLIQTLEFGGRKYGVLVSAEPEVDDTNDGAKPPKADDDEEEDDEGDILVLRIVDENGEEYFEEIDDDAEFKKVVAHLESLEQV